MGLEVLRMAGRSLVDTFVRGQSIPAIGSLGPGTKLRSVAKSGDGNPAGLLAYLLGRHSVEMGLVSACALGQPIVSASLPQSPGARNDRGRQRTIPSLAAGSGLRLRIQRSG